MEHESTVFFELRIKWSPALHYNYPSDFNDCLVFFCRPFDLLINWEMAVNYWMYRESHRPWRVPRLPGPLSALVLTQSLFTQAAPVITSCPL